jgi:hypothetical protein
MTSVLQGNGSMQTSLNAIRNQFYNINNQLKSLNETVDKLTDIVREIAIKTDVNTQILDAPAPSSQQQNVSQSGVQQQQAAPAPVLSGNIRRR